MIFELEKIKKSVEQGGRQIEILQGVSLKIAPGETHSIQGSSGSGKSTLLSILCGLDAPTAGAVRWDGEAIENKPESWRTQARPRHLGVVFQQFHLMAGLTALENVSLAYEILHGTSDLQRAREILLRVGLGDRLGHFPSQLSGGEKQRVAIARAFVTDPPLLVADEPSGNLDAVTGTEVMGLLFDRVQERGKALLLVTHDEALAARCKFRWKLTHGVLEAC